MGFCLEAHPRAGGTQVRGVVVVGELQLDRPGAGPCGTLAQGARKGGGTGQASGASEADGPGDLTLVQCHA